MALKCVYNYPGAVPEIVRIVRWAAHDLHRNKKSATIEAVFNHLRNSPIGTFELDAETVAYAYSQIREIVGRKNFSDQQQLEDFGGETMRKVIEDINNPTIKNSRLGKASVSQSVASGIAKTFSALQGMGGVNKSRMVQLRDAVRKAAVSQLDQQAVAVPKSKPQTFVEILESVFDVERLSRTADEATQGHVTNLFTSMDAMWRSVQEEIKTIRDNIVDASEQAAFDVMTQEVMNSSYDLLLSTKQVNDVIKGTMRDAGYTRMAGSQVVVDWNKALREQDDWKKVFTDTFINNGFNPQQAGRIVLRLEKSYEAALRKQADNRLNAIAQRAGKTRPVNKAPIERLIDLRHAGIFDSNNRQTLMEVFGIEMPDGIADEIAEMVRNYEAAIKLPGGNIGNIDLEMLQTQMRLVMDRIENSNKLSSFSQGFVDAASDYISLTAASVISTGFNSFQNITSGLFMSIISSIRPIARTKNLKLLRSFIKTWTNAYLDVSLGNVTIRDAKTINTLENLQGRGGLSDRWTWDQAKSPLGYIKALVTFLPQNFATAVDAANKAVIMQATMINNYKDILQTSIPARPGKNGRPAKTPAEANRAIDDVLFGKDASGKSNRKIWIENAKNRLAEIEVVAQRGVTASRLADEIIWSKLITDYGISPEEVRVVMSGGIRQGGLNLGHEGDLLIAPSRLVNWASSAMTQVAEQYKERGNHRMFLLSHTFNILFRAANMFTGGIGNWAILALETTPLGLAIAGADNFLHRKELRGPLKVESPKELAEQLKYRNAIKARLERGLMGTGVQFILYAILSEMLMGDDDEEKTRGERMKDLFEEKYKDRDVRRALDKMLPMTMAAELTYAYDKKSKQIDPDKISSSALLPMYLQGIKPAADYIWEQVFVKNLAGRINESLKYANYEKNKEKREELRAEAFTRNIGGVFGLPYVGWYDMVKREYRVVSTDFKPNPQIEKAHGNQFKKDLKNVDGVVDAFMLGSHMDILKKAVKD